MTETPRTAADDPVLGSNGYPSEDELQRIREWPWEGGFRSLMEYVRQRWAYADAGYWEQRGDRFAISTAGWSGNEDIIAALGDNQMFSMLCPLAWRAGGHYVYDVQEWDNNPVEGKRVLVRDPATPMHDGFRVAACDCESEAAQDAARQWDELREALSEVVQAMDTRPNPGGICTWTAAEHAAVGKAHRLLRATEGKQPCPNHRIEGVSPFCPDCGMTA